MSSLSGKCCRIRQLNYLRHRGVTISTTYPPSHTGTKTIAEKLHKRVRSRLLAASRRPFQKHEEIRDTSGVGPHPYRPQGTKGTGIH